MSASISRFPSTRKHNRGVSLSSRGILQAVVFILGDLVTGCLVYALLNWLLKNYSMELPFLPMAVWLGIWIIWRAYRGFYPGYGRSPQTELRLHTLSTIQIAVFQAASILALEKLNNNIFAPLLWLFILLLSLAVRYGLRSFMIHFKRFGRPISIIGGGKTAEIIISHLKHNPEYGFLPLAVYDDNLQLKGSKVAGIEVVGIINDAIIHPLTEQAILSIPGARADTQKLLINSIYSAFPTVWIVPDLFDVPNQAMQPHNIGNTATLEMSNNLRSIRSRAVKRTLDIIASVFGTLIISPILLIIVFVIKLDSPGPAIYRARRLGRDGEIFDCFKFRSMHRDADAKLREVLDSNPILKAEFEATHKIKDDPRVTRVGGFLRKFSLDEFPQLFNVIIGEMSLVGPRPIVQAEIEKYGDVYEIYKQVRPGMTGYWQANGRSDTSYDERVAMDKFYVTNWTPWLDIIILLQTVKIVILGKGAY